MAERKSFLLRLPADLLDEVSRWARDDLRSVNAQIEFVLREAIRRRRGERPADAQQRQASAQRGEGDARRRETDVPDGDDDA